MVEQHCPYLDADGLDPQCEHLLGLQEGVLVAYARVFPCGVLRREAVIGRVLVAASARKQGLARQLMQEAHRRLGAVEIAISAQAYLQPFYESLGYEVYSDGYDEDGIWHLPMRCSRALPCG